MLMPVCGSQSFATNVILTKGTISLNNLKSFLGQGMYIIFIIFLHQLYCQSYFVKLCTCLMRVFYHVEISLLWLIRKAQSEKSQREGEGQWREGKRNFDKTPERVKVIEKKKRSENRTENLSRNLSVVRKWMGGGMWTSRENKRRSFSWVVLAC